MSSIRNSKSAQILSEEKRAVYTHCHGHASNWALRGTSKSNPVCNYSLEIAFEICKLIDKKINEDISSVKKILTDQVDCSR